MISDVVALKMIHHLYHLMMPSYQFSINNYEVSIFLINSKEIIMFKNNKENKISLTKEKRYITLKNKIKRDTLKKIKEKRSFHFMAKGLFSESLYGFKVESPLVL